MVRDRYRPRQRSASPVWQVFHDPANKLPALHPEAPAAIATFLACGDLNAGFTRLHCSDCGHERLFAFTANNAAFARPATSAALSARVTSSPTRSAPRCPTGTSYSRLPY